MLTRSAFSSGSAAVAEQWNSQDGISRQSQDSHKKRLLSREPDSPSSGELIATAVPSDVAAAADAAAYASPVAAAAAAARAAGHSGLLGSSPGEEQEDLAGASFEQLCNDGSRWTWDNWGVKLYRWTLMCIKQLYLIFMTLTLPTNFLMVRASPCIDLGDVACVCLHKLEQL